MNHNGEESAFLAHIYLIEYEYLPQDRQLRNLGYLYLEHNNCQFDGKNLTDLVLHLSNRKIQD